MWPLLCRRRPTLPHSFPCSTIGPAGLNFRVRDGNGCDPRGKITAKFASRGLAALEASRRSPACQSGLAGLACSRRISRQRRYKVARRVVRPKTTNKIVKIEEDVASQTE